MIPDKIYIFKGDAIKLVVEQPNNVEYIRKDALLEWLESIVYQHNEDRYDDGFNTAIGHVIDKLNSL